MSATPLKDAAGKGYDSASIALSIGKDLHTIHADIPALGEPLNYTSSGWSSWKKDGSASSYLDAVATQPSVFDDPVSLEAYRPPPQYENAHRFDPLCRWTWREDKVRG